MGKRKENLGVLKVNLGGVSIRVVARRARGSQGCPCKNCGFDALLRRRGGGCSPRECGRYVRCMAHEREDGTSVYFEEA